MDRPGLVALLEEGGFVAADEEADELLAAAGGDAGRLATLVRRRLTGEPLAWVTGSVTFAGVTLRAHPGVYVPRWHSELLAERAAARLPERGVAIDLCTGTGAIAAVLRDRRPGARILATDLDPRAVACARANGVDAHAGDLFAGLPAEVAGGPGGPGGDGGPGRAGGSPGVRGRVDVVVGVVPYVPTPALPYLQRDTLAFESALSYDGGADGTATLRRAVAGAAGFLRPGGALLLELGGDEAEALAPDLAAHGFTAVAVLTDEDGDTRAVEATWAG